MRMQKDKSWETPFPSFTPGPSAIQEQALLQRVGKIVSVRFLTFGVVTLITRVDEQGHRAARVPVEQFP